VRKKSAKLSAERPKLAPKLMMMMNTDIIKCQELMYNDVSYVSCKQ